MLISNATFSNFSANIGKDRVATSSSSFQPAEPGDLVEIGRQADGQDRFIDLGPVVTVFGAGAGTIGGGVAGTIAYAFGAPGWVIPAAAVGCGIIGGVIGHASEK